MGRIVLIGEGQGDDEALPALVGKFLHGRSPWFVDDKVIRGGEYNKLASPRGSFDELRRMLSIALLRKDTRAILIVIDADVLEGGITPCQAAKNILEAAKEIGAGTKFSLSVVFADQEYESWFIAARDQLAGTQINGISLKRGNFLDVPSPIESRRDAKGWVRKHLMPSYNEEAHQGLLTKEMLKDASLVHSASRSFRRMAHAVEELIAASQSDQVLLSPQQPCCTG